MDLAITCTVLLCVPLRLQLLRLQADFQYVASTSPVQQSPAAPARSGRARISATKTLLMTVGSLFVLWLLGVLVAMVLDRP